MNPVVELVIPKSLEDIPADCLAEIISYLKSPKVWIALLATSRRINENALDPERLWGLKNMEFKVERGGRGLVFGRINLYLKPFHSPWFNYVRNVFYSCAKHDALMLNTNSNARDSIKELFGMFPNIMSLRLDVPRHCLFVFGERTSFVVKHVEGVELQSYTQLKKLDLSYCNITYSDIIRGSIFASVPSIDTLDLTGNINISIQGVVNVITTSRVAKNLSTLILANCGLFSTTTQLSCLVERRIEHCYIGTLIEAIVLTPNLKSLDLSENRCYDIKYLVDLIVGVAKNKFLKTLILSPGCLMEFNAMKYNREDGNKPDEIIEALKQNKNITKFPYRWQSCCFVFYPEYPEWEKEFRNSENEIRKILAANMARD